MPACGGCLQAAQPLAAKLLSGAQNASFQANATRDAARQAVSEAKQKLAALREQLKAAKNTRHAAQQALIGAPAQWGKAQFRVSRRAAGVLSQGGGWCAHKGVMLRQSHFCPQQYVCGV